MKRVHKQMSIQVDMEDMRNLQREAADRGDDLAEWVRVQINGYREANGLPPLVYTPLVNHFNRPPASKDARRNHPEGESE